MPPAIVAADQPNKGKRSDVIAAANRTGATGWKKGTTMTAGLVEATRSTLTKPLKGVKDKPLASDR